MQGDIVKAAKWLGGCMVAASLILVLGFHPTVTGRVVSFTKVQPEAVSPPTAPTPNSACCPTLAPSATFVPPVPYPQAQMAPDTPVAVTGPAVSN